MTADHSVTTRTSGLTPVAHPNFNIRFSTLEEIEDACKEDDEVRAERTIDWIGSRIASQAAAWLENPRMVEHERWWTELRACVEGERVPIRGEGWNHPVACMYRSSIVDVMNLSGSVLIGSGYDNVFIPSNASKMSVCLWL